MSWDIECYTNRDDMPKPEIFDDTCFLICVDLRTTGND